MTVKEKLTIMDEVKARNDARIAEFTRKQTDDQDRKYSHGEIIETYNDGSCLMWVDL